MRSPVPPVAPLVSLAAALAIAAGAQTSATWRASGGETPVVQRAAPRGPQTMRSAKSKPAPRTPLPVAFAPLAGRVAADIGQCQRGCGQTYYFCLSAAEPDGCPSAWTRCRADCSRGSAAP